MFMSQSHDLDSFDSLHASPGGIIGGALLNDFVYRHSPPFSQLKPHDPTSRSSVPFFEGLPFDSDSPSPFECPFATCVTHVIDKTRNAHIPFVAPSPGVSKFNSPRAVFVDEDDFELHGPTPLPSTRNVVSRAPTTKPFDHHNHLSFSFAAGFDVIPNDSDVLEDDLFSESEAEDSHPQQNQAGRCDADSGNIVLYFKKIVSGKKTKLASVTESIYDIRHTGAASNPSTISNSCLTFPELDLESSLDIAGCIPDSVPSASGRSRISKLQHEVLNTWFYSHLDHP
jgi:hypothetical protein